MEMILFHFVALVAILLASFIGGYAFRGIVDED